MSVYDDMLQEVVTVELVVPAVPWPPSPSRYPHDPRMDADLAFDVELRAWSQSWVADEAAAVISRTGRLR